jgi:hypothetical protein
MTAVDVQPMEFDTARLAFRVWQERHRTPYADMSAGSRGDALLPGRAN